MAARRGDQNVIPRTQSSVALSPGGENWILINASPDLREQVNRFDELHDVDAVRGTRISSVLLCDAEIDHSSGLLFMREADSLTVYSTPAVQSHLSESFTLKSTLESFCDVDWRSIPVGDDRMEATIPDLEVEATAFSVPGEPPSYSSRSSSSGDTIGLEFTNPDTGESLVYAPALGSITDSIYERIERSSVTLLDGTFWSDEEMSSVGEGGRTAMDMGHVPVDGPGGSLQHLRSLDDVRKVYIHINNTNPMLRRTTDARAKVEDAGFEVAYDGINISF